MAGGNVQAVQRIYEAWNADDWDAGVRLFDPRIEWRTSGLFPGFEPVYHGQTGVRQFWDTMKDAWQHFTIDVVRTHELGQTVVAAVRFDAAGRGSGVRVGLDFAHLWEFADGLVKRYASFETFEHAVEVATSQ